MELPIGYSCINPADHLVAPQQGQRIVSPHAFSHGGVGFESICPAPEVFKSISIPHHWVERCEESNGLRLDIWHLARRPKVSDAIYRFFMEGANTFQFVNRLPRVAEVATTSDIRPQRLF